MDQLFGDKPKNLKGINLLGALILRRPRGGMHSHDDMVEMLRTHLTYFAARSPTVAANFLHNDCKTARLQTPALEHVFKVEFGKSGSRYVGIVPGQEDHFLRLEKGYSAAAGIDSQAYGVAASSKRGRDNWVQPGNIETLNPDNPKSWWHFYQVIGALVFGIVWDERQNRHVLSRGNGFVLMKTVVSMLAAGYPWFRDWENYYDYYECTGHDRINTLVLTKGTMAKSLASKTEPGRQEHLFKSTKAKRGQTRYCIADVERLLWSMDDERNKILNEIRRTGADMRFLNFVP
jgi:hypothetical protein